MKSKIIGVSLIAAGILGIVYPPIPDFGPATAFVDRNANKYQRAQAQTVLIKTPHGAEGSGVVVHRGGKTFVWTANHVIDGEELVLIGRVIRVNGHKCGQLVFTGKVLATFPEVDIALLWVDCPLTAFEGAEFSWAMPVPGTPLFHVGNLLGEQFDGSVTRGIISQVGVYPEGRGWIWKVTDQADAQVLPGSSGGPVFQDSDGKILGLVVGGPEQGRLGVANYIPVRELARVARGYEWAILPAGAAPSDRALQDTWTARKPKPPVVIDLRKP